MSWGTPHRPTPTVCPELGLGLGSPYAVRCPSQKPYQYCQREHEHQPPASTIVVPEPHLGPTWALLDVELSPPVPPAPPVPCTFISTFVVFRAGLMRTPLVAVPAAGRRAPATDWSVPVPFATYACTTVPSLSTIMRASCLGPPAQSIADLVFEYQNRPSLYVLPLSGEHPVANAKMSGATRNVLEPFGRSSWRGP